jgi:hypothetical protein
MNEASIVEVLISFVDLEKHVGCLLLPEASLFLD